MLNKTLAKTKCQIHFFLPPLHYLYNWNISLQLMVAIFFFLDS